MSKLNRGIKTAQVGLRVLNLILDGVPATPVVSGFDEFGIKSVIDLGAGSYTLILDRPFERDCMVTGHAMLTVDGTLEVVAVAYDRVTVQTKVSGAPTDTKFSLQIMGSDSRFNY